MEESPNGKFEEAQKVELPEEDKKVVYQNVEEASSEFKFMRDIVIEANSESLKQTHGCNDLGVDGSSRTVEEEAEAKEKSQMIEILKEEEEEELSISGEASVRKSRNSGSCVTEIETKETEEKILPSSDETVIDVVSNEVVKTPSPLLSDEIDEVVSKGVLIGNEEINLPSSSEKDGLSSGSMDLMSKGIEEKVLPSFDENCGAPPDLTDVVAKGFEDVQAIASKQNTGESSQIVGNESVENTDNSPTSLANSNVTGSNNGVLESTGNPPIASLRQRHRPTSWRSCCGLFEVLRPSNR